MNRKFFRFLGSERKLAIYAACIALPVLGGMFLCQFLLGTMLRIDAQNTSSCWVSMLVARNPDIFTWLSGGALSEHTRQLLAETSQVGDIYRFEIWDASGHLALKSERMTSAGIADNTQRVAEAFVSGSIYNEVHAGNAPHNVPFFVESFIPVKHDGAVIGVFHVYLDQSDDEVLYERSLLLTEILISAMVLVAAGIPAYGIYRQMLQLRDARAQTLYVSEHDSLTGVPNRDRMEAFAKTALALPRRRPVAALVIDMDRFKDVNDSFGHAAGDKVLRAVAERLRSAIGEADAVARFGGEEFLILQVGRYQPNGANSLADHLIDALSQPYAVGGANITCGASIGIAISPPDANDFEVLVACAYSALYKSKSEGRSSVRFYEPGMDAKNRQRRQIEADIRRGLDTDSFRLAYQPIHHLSAGTLLGFEALLRWPEGWSPQSPAEFIPVAEESGLINRLGRWALETACKTAAAWSTPVKVNVNLSPVQFHNGDIASVVEDVLSSSGLEPKRLVLEVTESLWIEDKDSVLNQLKRLRRLGVSIALDDFGTGYSSLSYIWKFPFDTIKIDQSFVREMETDAKAAAIVRTVAVLGKILNLAITAEGIETAEQAEILRAIGCDKGQGFLFGPPLWAESAAALVNEAAAAPADTERVLTFSESADLTLGAAD
jgi:diguanylate cyclase (GGDEF)-like protein